MSKIIELHNVNKWFDKFQALKDVSLEVNQQEKIVIVINGEIKDYCLDLRKNSKTFGKIFKFKLKKNSILYIPKGFAHGYLALSNNTQMIYLLSEGRYKKYERTIRR